MRRLPGGRTLSFCYFLPVGALALVLALLGYLVDLLLPPSASLTYQRAVLAVLDALARPLDGLHAAGADTTD